MNVKKSFVRTMSCIVMLQELQRKAGYSETSAHNQGSRLLREQDCIERIAELSSDITTDIDVINELEKQYDIAKKFRTL